MGGMTGQHESAKTEVVSTGKQKVIDGYTCTGYTLTREGKEIETVWATKDIPNLTSIRKDFLHIASLFTSISGSHNAFASLELIDGFPLERSRSTGTIEKIRNIKKGSFPASAFEVPPGYTKEKSRIEQDDKE
jgi:hypothetical protein